MSLLALIVSNSVVSFILIVMVDHHVFGIHWDAAAAEALIATALGHLLGLIWLYGLRKD